MNFANLEKEISKYKSLSTQEELTLNKLSLFFKTLSKQGLLFTGKVKTSIEELGAELSKEIRNTTHNISLSRFFMEFK